jgi:ABC-type sugar transport system substrate-binding protein
MISPRGEAKLSKNGEKIMYQIKKIVFVFIIVAMALAGCAKATETTAPAVQPTAVPAAVEGALPKLACAPNCQYEDLVVGFLQTGSEGGWRAANTSSFKETAEQLGMTLKFYDSQN